MNEPIMRPVGDCALLVEFGETIDEAVNARVMALDSAFAASPPIGVVELVPAYASLLVVFDPLLTDHGAVSAEVGTRIGSAAASSALPSKHRIPVCYDGACAPDLPAVAERLGMHRDDVTALHVAARYRVYMYGFAPGYAYMGGVPAGLHLPRKPQPVRGHPVGSVLIAGGQCLITTRPMPTGWWVIGRTQVEVLRPEAKRPFLFEPGDLVHFERASERCAHG